MLGETYFWNGGEAFSRGLGLFTLRDGRVETSALELIRQGDRLLAKISGNVDLVEQRVDAKSEFYNSLGRSTLRVDLTDALDAPRPAIMRAPPIAGQ